MSSIPLSTSAPGGGGPRSLGGAVLARQLAERKRLLSSLVIGEAVGTLPGWVFFLRSRRAGAPDPSAPSPAARQGGGKEAPG